MTVLAERDCALRLDEHASHPAFEQLRVRQIHHGAGVMLRHAGESDGLDRLPRAGEQLLDESAAAVAISGHLVPVRRAELSLHRHIQPAHDERYAGFEHDLRRIRVVVDVELRRGRHIAADGRAAHQGDGVQKSVQVRVLGQRDGYVGQRARGDEPQLAGIRFAAAYSASHAGVCSGAVSGRGSCTFPRPFSPWNAPATCGSRTSGRSAPG